MALATEAGLDDDLLWGRVRQGDEDALAVLFRRHASVIYNYCFRRLGDWAAAEDMVSIVFLEAWRRRDASVQPGHVLPWLYGIATNVVRNRKRSERRFAAALHRLPPELLAPDPADGVAARVDDERRMKGLLALVSELPQGEQDVLALHVLPVLRQMQVRPTAQASGLSVAGIKKLRTGHTRPHPSTETRLTELAVKHARAMLHASDIPTPRDDLACLARYLAGMCL